MIVRRTRVLYRTKLFQGFRTLAGHRFRRFRTRFRGLCDGLCDGRFRRFFQVLRAGLLHVARGSFRLGLRRRFVGFADFAGFVRRGTHFGILRLGLRGAPFRAGFRAGIFKLAVIGHYGGLNELDRSRIDAGNCLELLGRHGAQALDGPDSGFEQLLRQRVAHSIVEQNGNRRAGGHQGGHLRLDFLALLFLALDVDLPAQQLGRQAHVLALLADGERELRIVDDDFHVLLEGIDDHNPADLGRTQRMGGKDDGVVGILDDVDFLAAQLTDDGLHAHALHAHASAHAVHIAVAALHGGIGALAGFARATLDGDRTVVNLRDFLFEEAHDQFGRRPRYQHSGPLAGFVDELNDAAYAVSHAIAFQAGLFLLGQLGFGFAEVQHVVRTFHALDGAVDEFAGAPRILLEHGVAFGLADLLEDDLLGGLGGDSPQGLGVLGNAHFAADFHFGIDPPRLAHRHLMYWIFDGFHGLLERVEFDRAGLGIHVREVILVGAIVLASGNQHGVLDRVEHDLRVDAFFLAQDFDGLKDRFQSALLVSNSDLFWQKFAPAGYHSNFR